MTTAAIEDRREWMAACNVQRRLMGRVAPAGPALDYSAGCRQADEVGGDCYDFVPLPDGRLAVAVGDASGKGLPAALMISGVQASLRTAALFDASDGAAVIGAVNRHVYSTSLSDRYATLFYAIIDRVSRVMRYVNAGHTPPLLLRRDGAAEWLESGGAPVGMFEDWSYEEGRIELRPGDVIVACTDGITEAENATGEMWGLDGLQRAATANYGRTADEMVAAVFDAMNRFTGGRQSDDATVVALRIV